MRGGRRQPAAHQAGRSGRPVRPSPAAAGVPAVAQGAASAAAAAGPHGVLLQGCVARDAGDEAGGGAQRRPGPVSNIYILVLCSKSLLAHNT